MIGVFEHISVHVRDVSLIERCVAWYLNNIFVDAHFASQNFKRPDFCQRAHSYLCANSRRCLAEVPALLLTECWNVKRGIEKVRQEGLGNVRHVRFVGTVELVHENIDKTQRRSEQLVARLDGVPIDAEPRKLSRGQAALPYIWIGCIPLPVC